MSFDNVKNAITTEQGVYYVDYTDGDWPVARIYEVTDPAGEPVKGLTAKIHYDDDHSMDPRKTFDNFGVMFSLGNDGYLWGDKQISQRTDFEITCSTCEGTGYVSVDDENALEGSEPDEDGEVFCGKCEGDGTLEVGAEEWLRKEHDAVVILGVHFADYGSNPSRCWVTKLDGDDSDNGAIIATKEQIIKEYGADALEKLDEPLAEAIEGLGGAATNREAIESVLTYEVKTYCQYMEGDVYFNEVEDSETSFNYSLGGLYGHEYAEEAIYESIEEALERREAEFTERRLMAERDIETVN